MPTRALEVGRRVRSFRQTAGVTQEQLAERADVGIASVQRIEQGQGNPSLGTLFALADALGCRAVDLVPE